MIGIPSEFAPSTLLHCEGISPDIQRLLEASRDARKALDWAEARAYVEDAYKICEEENAHVSLALAEIHLADYYGDVGEIGRAMKLCESASKTFRRQPRRIQQHNEAIAAYALGILQEQQLFGNPLEARNSYQRALQRLEGMQEYWAECRDKAKLASCQDVYRHIKSCKDRIMNDRIKKTRPQGLKAQQREAITIGAEKQTDQDELRQLRRMLAKHFNERELRELCFDLRVDYDDLSGSTKSEKIIDLIAFLHRRGRIPDLIDVGQDLRRDLPWADTFEVDNEASLLSRRSSPEDLPLRPVFDIWEQVGTTPFTKSSDLRGYIIGDTTTGGYRALINGTTYRLRPLPGGAFSTSRINYHFALRIPADGWATPGTTTDDYALIRLQLLADEENVGIVWEPGTGWCAVDFERDADGNITFFSRPRIIGGMPSDPANRLKGYIVAILVPE